MPSFGVVPPFLWQHFNKHYTNISVETAGNQVRDAKGMKVIQDVVINHSSQYGLRGKTWIDRLPVKY